MYKTIVVQVDGSPQLDSRLQAAAWLANAHGAHLVGSAATGLAWPAYALLTGSMAVAPGEEFDALRAGARAALRRFAERARQLGVASVEERLVEDDARDALLLQARYADLLVASQDERTPGSARALPQYLALDSARPVLVVPPHYTGQALTGTIVAGWDGSVPALRAICAAMPLLQAAQTVRLALVNPEREAHLHGDEPGADMAVYLARHGVRVEVVVERTHGAQARPCSTSPSAAICWSRPPLATTATANCCSAA